MYFFRFLSNVLLASVDYKINIEHEAVLSIYSYWKNEKVVSFTNEETAQIEADASIGFSLFEILSEKIKFFCRPVVRLKTKLPERLSQQFQN